MECEHAFEPQAFAKREGHGPELCGHDWDHIPVNVWVGWWSRFIRYSQLSIVMRGLVDSFTMYNFRHYT